ncbi:hypothetical protein GCM10027275_49380 [Rhabdobacter roseus]|uniref:Putative membrane protein YkoI n=1 Tax=Rhabdobacter roseus TaxID=1655419 RepID=A0A840U5A8_9BACT|nr:PepSY-like domain-containing protein [Rhabdobacter roseus]MBB5286999.1 putative membrane protein YkoI [Rhabdobacter roseus]
MKKSLLALLCGAFLLTSCAKQDKPVTPATAAVLSISNVPSLVLASMARNYPAVTDVTWRQTAPTAYMATFRQNGAARTATFQKTGTLTKAGEVIDPAVLPQAVTDYLTTNYPGYVIVQADVRKDATGAVKGYETLITLNDVQYELEFNAVGTFTKLETPNGHEQGNGIAASALPKVITDYLTANYPGYTFREAETRLINGTLTNYQVEILQNGTLFELNFDAAGVYLGQNTDGEGHGGKEGNHDGEQGNHDGEHDNGQQSADSLITQTALPAAVSTYLRATYPGYTFVSAAIEKDKAGSLKYYEVKFTLAGKAYEAEFDAAGKFIKLEN